MAEFNILDPVAVIQELFGNMMLFAAVALIGYLYLCGRYRLNLQLTVVGSIAILGMGAILNAGFSSILIFVVFGSGLFIAYIIWRWMASR